MNQRFTTIKHGNSDGKMEFRVISSPSVIAFEDI